MSDSQLKAYTETDDRTETILLNKTQREYFLDALTVYKKNVLNGNKDIPNDMTEIKLQIVLNAFHQQLRSPVEATQSSLEVRPEHADVLQDIVTALENRLTSTLRLAAFDDCVSNKDIDKIDEQVSELKRTLKI